MQKCHICLITYGHMWDVLMAQSKYFFMISVVASSLWSDSSVHTHTHTQRNWKASAIFLKIIVFCLRKNTKIANSLNSFSISFKTLSQHPLSYPPLSNHSSHDICVNTYDVCFLFSVVIVTGLSFVIFVLVAKLKECRSYLI